MVVLHILFGATRLLGALRTPTEDVSPFKIMYPLTQSDCDRPWCTQPHYAIRPCRHKIRNMKNGSNGVSVNRNST